MKYLDKFKEDQKNFAENGASRILDFVQSLQRESTQTSLDNEALLKIALSAVAEAEKTIEAQEQKISKLTALSTTDELTQLLNRRGFNHQLRRILKSAKRYDEQGVLVICDINAFKRINDSYGHPAGDKVLEEIAQHLHHTVRGTDVVGRLGGDEFAILFTKTTLKQAQKKIAEINLALANRPVLWDGESIDVSVSAGFAHFHGEASDVEVYIDADRDLYHAKIKSKRKQGRKLEVVKG